jgi:LuxR family transcriptional regulator, maltose regulon positive regulatory protein
VRSADWSGAAGPPVAPAVRDGVVSRPGLFELLGRAGRVTEVTAPAGSGKTLLLRSWIGESGLAERAAWVPVQGEERDPQRFWLSVLGALRDTAAEVTGLAHWAQLTSWRSFPLGAQRSMQAIELAGRHGWTEEPVAGIAYLALGMAMVALGRLEEGEQSLEQAERILREEAEPAAAMRLRYARGLLAVVTGRPEAALGAFRAAERLAGLLVTEHALARRLRSHVLQTLVRLGQTQRVEQALAEMGGPERDSGQMRNAVAVLRLAQDDPEVATVALAPVINGSVPLPNAHLWDVQAWLLEAIARDALGDAGAARRALERALHLAKPEGLLFPFLLDPAPGLLERHRRTGTAHAILISEILNLLAGRTPAAPSGHETEVGTDRKAGGGQGLLEPLSHSEIRVLRYLPTKLSVPEIADQLYLSVNTVKTHMRHLYDKLGVHRRHEAVEQARALGMLAPSPRGR